MFPYEAVVVDNIAHDVILGKDFLTYYQGINDLQEPSFSLQKSEETQGEDTEGEDLSENEIDAIVQELKQDKSRKIAELNDENVEEPIYQVLNKSSQEWKDSFPPEIRGTKLNNAEKDHLPDLLKEKRDVFALHLSELRRTNIVKHRIETRNATPFKQHPY